MERGESHVRALPCLHLASLRSFPLAITRYGWCAFLRVFLCLCSAPLFELLEKRRLMYERQREEKRREDKKVPLHFLSRSCPVVTPRACVATSKERGKDLPSESLSSGNAPCSRDINTFLHQLNLWLSYPCLCDRSLRRRLWRCWRRMTETW